MADTVVATIDTSRSSQLRIAISQWRAKRRVEVREATAVIPGIFFPTRAGVMLDIEQLPALIEALRKAVGEARKRGWLK